LGKESGEKEKEKRRRGKNRREKSTPPKLKGDALIHPAMWVEQDSELVWTTTTRRC
jgi:hypothetical protein